MQKQIRVNEDIQEILKSLKISLHVRSYNEVLKRLIKNYRGENGSGGSSGSS